MDREVAFQTLTTFPETLQTSLENFLSSSMMTPRKNRHFSLVLKFHVTVIA